MDRNADLQLQQLGAREPRCWRAGGSCPPPVSPVHLPGPCIYFGRRGVLAERQGADRMAARGGLPPRGRRHRGGILQRGVLEKCLLLDAKRHHGADPHGSSDGCVQTAG